MTTSQAPHDYLTLIMEGLSPRATRPKKVVVVGAGMAGLVAASELLRAGHDPVIIEARGRVGGRVHTLREPFSDGLYAEAGAMRIPLCHALTMAYVAKFGLPTSPFTASNPKAFAYIHGRRYRLGEVEADPGLFNFELAAREARTYVFNLWNEALAPLLARLRDRGEEAWTGIVAECDQYSMREFLEAQGWSNGCIELFGILSQQEALMNSSFLELFREEAGGYYTNLVEIEGGMDRLPRAFLPFLRDRIRFGAKMKAIDQTPDSVVVHFHTPGGGWSASGDYAIVTAPFPVLRHVEALKPFSRGKQRAIRQLHYDASAKIVMQFRRRFWEEDDGIFGGGTMTDLPVRAVFYPDHGRETGRGVLLASYTWSEDAQRWGSLSDADRISEALEDLAQIHPQAPAEFEAGASKMWHDDEFAGGAFALFDPGQQALLYADIVAPEGRIHFAGEHASLHHAWVRGAIESGLRAAAEVHARSFVEA